MAIRLRAHHRDLAGSVRTLFIYDAELGASTTDVVICTDEFYTIKWEGDENDIFKKIIPANCTFTFYLEHPMYTEEQRNKIRQFYEDFINSYEGRFYVKCQYGETLGEIKPEFYGKILPDIGTLVLDFFQTATLTAVDGISQLKNIEYRPEGYTDLLPEWAIRTDSFVEHFTAILKLNDVVQFFQEETNSFGYSLFTTSGHWTESKSIAGDIFKQVRVRNFYYEQISPSYRKYDKAWDVLEDLLAGFVARCIYADGVYHIEQLTYQDNNDPVAYGYNFDGDPMVGTYFDDKSTKELWAGSGEDNLQVLTWPSKRWLAPLKAVQLTQNKGFTNYINNLSIDLTNPGPHDLGTIITDGDKLVAALYFDVEFGPQPFDLQTFLTSAPSYQGTFYWDIEMTIQNGAYYLDVEPGLLNPTGYVEILPTSTWYWNPIVIASWSLSPKTVKVRYTIYEGENWLGFQQEAYDLLKNRLAALAVVIDSDPLPELDANLFFTINSVQAYYIHISGEIIAAPNELTSIRKNSKIIIAPNGYTDLYEKPKEFKIFEVGNVKNTEIYQAKLRYYDSETLDTQQLFIKNATYVTTQEPTTEWTDPDAGITLPIQRLMMSTILSLRKAPGTLLKCDVYFRSDARISFRDRMVVGGDLYLIMSMELLGGTGVYKLDMWKMYKDSSDIIEVDTGSPLDTPDPGPPLPDGSGDPEFPGGGVGLEHYQEWFNVGTNYVDLDLFLANYIPDSDFNIKTKWHFLINGVRQRYLDATPVLRSWRFSNPDPSINRIEFFKPQGNVAHIELFKYY